MDRKGILIGFLAGGWLATVLIFLVPHLGLGLSPALAGDTVPIPIPVPIPPGGQGTTESGANVNPITGSRSGGGFANPGLGTSDSNRRAIALSASIGSGQSVVYYFDTEAERLCVYQYSPGRRGGLRLLAARMIGFDLKLRAYRDLSEKSPEEMQKAYEAAVEGAKGHKARPLPTKRVELPMGK